jgi:hypothetical protein
MTQTETKIDRLVYTTLNIHSSKGNPISVGFRHFSDGSGEVFAMRIGSAEVCAFLYGDELVQFVQAMRDALPKVEAPKEGTTSDAW